MTESELSRFVVVLCGAEESGNVGSVCRAMKTMGLSRLRLAACPEHDADIVRMMAVHAAELYEGAERHADLASALAGSSLAAGFTRRRGGRRKSFSLSVADFARGLGGGGGQGGSGEVALVFGNERSGLSGEELGLCTLAVHIPSSEAFPSLNLAQAVQIACYELRRQALGGREGSYEPASLAEIDAVVLRARERLADLGFFRLTQGRELSAFLRDLASRAALSPAELRYFEAFIHKMAGLAARGAAPGEAGPGSGPA